MSYYSVWPILLILAILLGFTATPLFKAADAPPIPAGSRVASLDGLRGFLALAVFFQHAAVYHTYIGDGRWNPPTDRLYGLLGSFGVSMFFMITGFLFWSQLLGKKGRPDWLRLYIGRVFRIAPIYLFALAIMLVCVFAVTGLRLRVSSGTLARELAKWSCLGVWNGTPINGLAQPDVFLAHVTWSLRWEWFFYASLIPTSLFARNRVSAWILPSICFVVALALLPGADAGRFGSPSAFVALFCVGMLTATARAVVAGIDFRKPAFSAIAATLMLVVLARFRTAYDLLPICLLGVAFFMVANGTTIFGLLATRPARRLGDVSLGIYLLQGLVLAAVFAPPAARTFALGSPFAHWAVIGLAALLLVSVATAVHALIERPGVDLGRKVSGMARFKINRSAARVSP